ncbi:MAG: MBL fold metallo-hydrolase [Patescibacteria group bacterium]|nr:MBL fold metallo-hydrolase [Patescibacteria group bacterium]
MFEEKNKNLSLAILVILVGLDIFLWFNILFFSKEENKIYFLDVGQGDSSLIILENISILIDAGPSSKIIQSLDKVFSKSKKYIDLAIITHPELDHFGGFLKLLDSYKFGLFIINGRKAEGSEIFYEDLIKKIKNRNISIITLLAGDKILYKDNLIEIISPDKNWWSSADLNDTGLVLKIKNKNFQSLFTADIGQNLENYLAKKFDLKSDILKVAHHGSKYSSGASFLKEVSPSLALVGVGLNRYGHPSAEVIDRFQHFKIPIFRTDQHGTMLIFKKDNKFIVKTQK